MIPEPIVIRRAVKEDIPHILQLWDQLLVIHEKKDPAYFKGSRKELGTYSSVLNDIINKRSVFIYVATVRHEIIAVVFGSIKKRKRVFEYERVGIIDALYVAEHYRKQGLSRKLIDKVIAQFKLNRIEFAEVRLYSPTPDAKTIWERLGFNPYMVRLRRKV